jgi:hypothetical protein
MLSSSPALHRRRHDPDAPDDYPDSVPNHHHPASERIAPPTPAVIATCVTRLLG